MCVSRSQSPLTPVVHSYEPELHPGATYQWKEKKATFKIFQTGAITITAPSVAAIEFAVQHIFPLVYEFRKEKPADSAAAHLAQVKRKQESASGGRHRKRLKRQTSCDSSSESDGIVPDGEEEEADALTSEEEAAFTSGSDSDQDDQ